MRSKKPMVFLSPAFGIATPGDLVGDGISISAWLSEADICESRRDLAMSTEMPELAR